MRRIATVLTVVAVMTLLTLIGCGHQNPQSSSSDTRWVSEAQVHLKDSRTVTCVLYYGGGRGISCDWANAR